MADRRKEFSFLSKICVKIDLRFDISTSVRWQAGISRGVDILATSAACTSDVNTLKSCDFKDLLQPFPTRAMITEFGQHDHEEILIKVRIT